jgi:hypothetical protein
VRGTRLRMRTIAMRLAVSIRRSVTSDAEANVPTGGELTLLRLSAGWPDFLCCVARRRSGMSGVTSKERGSALSKPWPPAVHFNREKKGTGLMIVHGADVRKSSHTIAGIAAATGEMLGHKTARVGTRGFREVLLWARGLGADRPPGRGLSPPVRLRRRLRAVGRHPRLRHRERQATCRSSVPVALVASAGSLHSSVTIARCDGTAALRMSRHLRRASAADAVALALDGRIRGQTLRVAAEVPAAGARHRAERSRQAKRTRPIQPLRPNTS